MKSPVSEVEMGSFDDVDDEFHISYGPGTAATADPNAIMKWRSQVLQAEVEPTGPAADVGRLCIQGVQASGVSEIL